MRTIASLIYPDVMSLDVTGPLQVFASANVELRRQGQAEAYRLRVLGEQAGPVATSAGFQLVAEQAWRDCAAAELDTLLVPGGLAMTTSRDVLEALSGGNGPRRVLITLGYAGWGAGQLEDELSRNGWLTVDADPAIIFDTPAEQRYQRALSLLGIDPAFLAQEAGHA